MERSKNLSKITLHETKGCLAVPIQEELSREAALQIQKIILEKVSATGVKGVVIDLSGLNVMDSVLAGIFINTVKMVRLLGADTAITGISPGVAASVVDLNLAFDGIKMALNLEDGLEILTSPKRDMVGNQQEKNMDGLTE